MRSYGAASYASVAHRSADGRELEAQVLLKAAAQLRAHFDPSRPTGLKNDPGLNDCLRRNQQIWTIFQAELSSDRCGMPVELRRNLLKLSLYVDKVTFNLVADPNSARLQQLVTINENIAAGLLSKRSRAASPSPNIGQDAN